MAKNHLFSTTEADQQGRRERLPDEHARSLLPRVSVIRDPLHGDIRITALERRLIDTPAYQRLRRINQLAMVDVVYPGATHTRFLHSLGTLHVCSEMIAACNNSTKLVSFLAAPDHPIPVRIGYYAELLARLVALLHDTAHVPFGHVFEREAQVFERDEWQDPWRVARTLGSEGDFTVALRDFLGNHFGSHPSRALRLSKSEAQSAADVLIQDIMLTLTAKGASVFDLRYPFVYDLVGNTICADLIDYIQRDMYFCGLTEGLGQRFMQYLAVIPVRCRLSDGNTYDMQPLRLDGDDVVAPENSPQQDARTLSRLVLMQYRYNKRNAPSVKSYILGEAIDLVRRRKQVAERLYFHKTKLMATSMLSAAVHASGIDSAEPIWALSDTEVLHLIADRPVSSAAEAGASQDEKLRSERRRMRARNLGHKILRRELFKCIYQAAYYPPDREDDHSRRLWAAYGVFSKPHGRERLIEGLECVTELGLGLSTEAVAGSVSISCPNRDMQLKGFEMLVLPRPDKMSLEPLQQTVHPVVSEEIRVIQKGHQELWKLEVFVDPRVVPLDGPLARTLAAIAADAVGVPNELPEFADVQPMKLNEVLRRMRIDDELERLNLRAEIKEVHYQELCSAAGESRDDIRSVRDKLRDWGYTVT